MGHSVCGSAGQQILYGWGKNAPPMALPEGVGFQVGPGTAAHSLVLQVTGLCSLRSMFQNTAQSMMDSHLASASYKSADADTGAFRCTLWGHVRKRTPRGCG